MLLSVTCAPGKNCTELFFINYIDSVLVPSEDPEQHAIGLLLVNDYARLVIWAALLAEGDVRHVVTEQSMCSSHH